MLWIVIILVALAAAGSLIIRLKEVLYPEPAAAAVPAPACDLGSGPCTAPLPLGGEVTFSIEPRAIPVARPLVLRVAVQGVEVSGVAVDLAGLDMNMGYNRPSLTPESPGHFRGDAMLPVCVRSRMTWEARVLLTTPRGLLVAPFQFATSRSS